MLLRKPNMPLHKWKVILNNVYSPFNTIYFAEFSVLFTVYTLLFTQVGSSWNFLKPLLAYI